MGLMDTLRSKYELHRLEKRYTRREKRTTFVSGAQYIDGEYVYPSDLPSPSLSSTPSSSSPSSPSAMSSSSAEERSSASTSPGVGASGTGSGFGFPSAMSRAPSAGWGAPAAGPAPASSGPEVIREEEEAEEGSRASAMAGNRYAGDGNVSPWHHAGSAMNGYGSVGEKKGGFWKRS